MPRMKIAVWHNLPSGGGKRALYYHVKGLLQRGHTVESWCPSTADQSYLPLNELITEHILPFSWKESPQTTTISRGRAALFEVGGRLKAMDSHCRQCADQINKGGFDLLFANSSSYIAIAPIARYITIPKILYLQEPTRPLYEAMPMLPWIAPHLKNSSWLRPGAAIEYFKAYLKIRSYRAIATEEWLNIKAYDAVLVNSFFSRESVLRAFGVNAHVCYLGIDSTLFTDRHQRRDTFLVGVGSLSPTKNIEFVIRSLAHVGNPRPRLIWIGNASFPPYVNQLKQLAKILSVDFEPQEMITDDELIDILNRAAMMVYAPRLEPFGFAPLEANACGLPVVAVAEGGVRETIVDGVNGLLVEPDEKTMARAIEIIRDDKELAHALGQEGRNRVVGKWSLAAAIDHLEQQFEEVLQTHAK
jgi:glycosyltransferase involved in cell wall biosynthesis